MALTYHTHVLVDGEVREDGPTRSWPSPQALTSMEGYFETIKVQGGKPAFFREHFLRLHASCAAHGFKWKVGEGELRARADRLIHANRCSDGSIRIVVVRDAKGERELIFSRDPAYPAQTYVRGFRLKTMPDEGERPQGPAHKTTSYARNMAAREAAHAAGFDEALFIGASGVVLEGAVTNIFAVVKGTVATPPLSVGILPGIARSQIVAGWSGVEERVLTLDMLLAADEVFVTNALLGVMPVSAVDGHSYPVGQYQVTRRITDAFYTWQEDSL